MLCFEVNCSTSLWLKPYKIKHILCHWLHWCYNATTITHPYECNVIGGFFELKWLLEFSFSTKVNI